MARQRNPSSVRSGIFHPDGAGEFYPVTILQRCRTYGAAVGERFTSGFLHLASWRLCAFALNSFPIPAASPEKQKPVERLVERLLAAKPRDAGADVSALERELDELVYALYGLTKEERDIVQAAAK
jgi:hypothetical protein